MDGYLKYGAHSMIAAWGIYHIGLWIFFRDVVETLTSAVVTVPIVVALAWLCVVNNKQDVARRVQS